MKFCLVFLAILPFVISATVDEKRFIENLLGGIDVLDLAQQLLCQFGSDETEQQCEDSMCPELLKSVGLDFSALLTAPACALVCEEAQALANTYACN